MESLDYYKEVTRWLNSNECFMSRNKALYLNTAIRSINELVKEVENLRSIISNQTTIL